MSSLLFFSALSVELRAPELIIMHAAARVMYMEDVKEKVMKTERGQRRVKRASFGLAG